MSHCRFLTTIILAFAAATLLASCRQGNASSPDNDTPAVSVVATNNPAPAITATSRPVVPTATPTLQPATIESAIQRIFDLFLQGDFETVNDEWMADDFALLYDNTYPPLADWFANIKQWKLEKVTNDVGTMLNYKQGAYTIGLDVTPVNVAIVDVKFNDASRSFPPEWTGTGVEDMRCFLFFMSPALNEEGRWEIVFLEADISCNAPLAALTPTPDSTPTTVIVQSTGGQPFATPTPYQACPGTSPPTRLWVGGYAAVSMEPPLPNNVREGPGTNNHLIGKIQAGYPMEILDGPECANNWTWWKVRSLVDGLTGWTAEGDANGYWLVPCPPESECGNIEQP